MLVKKKLYFLPLAQAEAKNKKKQFAKKLVSVNVLNMKRYRKV